MKLIKIKSFLHKIKTKDVLFFSFSIALFLSFIMLISSAFNKVDMRVNAEASRNIYPPVVVIDPGHGGEDGGASTKDGILEKDINLKIAKELNLMLGASGFKTIMTRDEDISIHSDEAKSTREHKISDIKNRLNIIEKNPGCIVISIHQNKFEQSQYSGTQIFYSVNNENSKILAESIKSSVVKKLQPQNTREVKPADKGIYLLHNTKQTAVLVECGFLSNPSEAKNLNDEEYQKKLSFAIYSGFMDYLNLVISY